MSEISRFAEIVPEHLYPLAELKRRLGWGDSAIRAARRGGLPFKYAHGRVFALGVDIIRYVVEHGTDSPPHVRPSTAAARVAFGARGAEQNGRD